MTPRLDHVNIAVEDAGELAARFGKLLGLETISEEVVEEQGVRLVKLGAGDSAIEITEPLGPETPVGRFLKKRGEGLHHLAFQVPDIEAALARLKAGGATLIDETPRIGAGGHRIAFVHPKTFGGVLVEITEHSEP